MDDPHPVNRDLWHAFLDKHMVSATEQEAFLDYLTRPDTAPVDTLEALEDAYRHFLRLGLPPVDIH
jgi:hypothetical protein